MIYTREQRMIETWQGVFAIGKGITYLLAMACMIRYLMG
jgi:hypothetical protein